MPSGTGIAPPRCHPPPDGGTLRHVNNSLPGPVSEGSVHGNGSRQPDNRILALAEPFVTVLAHGNGVYVTHLLRSLVHRPHGVILFTSERAQRAERVLSYLKGQSQLVKGRPIYSNDCGKSSLCQLDYAQQRKSDTTLYFRHKFIFQNLMVKTSDVV